MAESETPPPAAPQDDVDALETAEDGSPDVIDATGGQKVGPPSPSGGTPKPKGGLKNKLRKFNIYFLVFLFILVGAGGILMVAYFQSKQATSTSTVKDEDLTQATLQQIASSDATVGSSQQVLNVQSSAVFAGKVLIRDGLEVAANLQVGGTTALTNLAVSGTSQFGQVQINKGLAVASDTAVQGSLTAKSLQISGGGTFSGPVSAPQLTTSSLQLNSDLILTKHIAAGGPTPSLSRGPALGGGGTASVSGSDTSGSISVNVGSGAAAGCFATINFAAKFNATPHVTITPVGPDGGTIDYYVTRTSTSFSVCDATAPPGGSSFAFDYLVIE